MFLFGLKMLWEAWRMKSDEAEETQREVEQELGVMDGQPVSTEDTGDEIMIELAMSIHPSICL